MKVYVVYCLNNEDPNAVCVDRHVACEIADFLSEETSVEHWVSDLDVDNTLEEFKESF